MNRHAQIEFGHDFARLAANSLRPMVRAIASALGPSGRGVLVSRGGGSPVILWKGSDIAREMPSPAGTAGTAPRMLKETLFAFDRDHRDGSSRLAIMAEALLRALIREEAAGTSAAHLGGAMEALIAGVTDVLDTELRQPADLAQVARASGLAGAMAADLASLTGELGADAAFDIREGSMSRDSMSRAREGFTLEVKILGIRRCRALLGQRARG